MNETHCLELMTLLLGGLGRKSKASKDSHYTAHGTQSVIEFRGQYYRVVIEPVIGETLER